MIGYVVIICEIIVGMVILEMKSVNLCFFDLQFCINDDLCVVELMLCEVIMGCLVCGKVECCLFFGCKVVSGNSQVLNYILVG